MAVAVFQEPTIQGEVLFLEKRGNVEVYAVFTKLPPGEHGFHIHKAGDLRGEGCKGACEHFDLTKSSHGDKPGTKGPRHTGDLGNMKGPSFQEKYVLKNLSVKDIFGRSVIVHEDPDDLGKGTEEDSKITGHSGKRIGCAIIGRVSCTSQKGGTTQTRKNVRVYND